MEKSTGFQNFYAFLLSLHSFVDMVWFVWYGHWSVEIKWNAKNAKKLIPHSFNSSVFSQLLSDLSFVLFFVLIVFVPSFTGYELTLVAAPRAMQATSMGLFYCLDGIANLINLAAVYTDYSEKLTFYMVAGVLSTLTGITVLILISKKFGLRLDKWLGFLAKHLCGRNCGLRGVIIAMFW